MFQLFKDLLIHGEGGDGGAGAAPGAEAPGTEAAGVTVPDAGEQRQNRRPNKAERRAALEAKLAAERAAAQPQQQQTAQQQAEQKQPERTPWEEIKKQYKDEYGKDVQTAIQGRFKAQKDEEAKSKRMENLLSRMGKSRYEDILGEDGALNLDALEKAVDNDDELLEEEAAKRGLSVETYKYVDKLEREKAEREAKDRDFLQQQQFARHMEQANAFKQKVPNFDLVSEMETTPLFAHLLSCGVPVENAYYAAHHEELMAVGQQAAAVQAQRALSANIQAGQSMPTEGGLGRSPAASPQRVTNPRQWTKAQRAEIRRRVQRGEEIYL